MAGYITVFTGPMKAAKSIRLILAAVHSEFAKKKVQCFHLEKSSRWDCSKVISSRMSSKDSDGNEQKISYPSTPLFSLDNFFTQNLRQGTNVVIFDEAQFFSNDLVEVCKKLRRDGIDVYIAGLDLDSFEVPFGPMGQLMCIAQKVEKIAGVCDDCGEEAYISYRLVENRAQELIGDDIYLSLCYDCRDYREEWRRKEWENTKENC